MNWRHTLVPVKLYRRDRCAPAIRDQCTKDFNTTSCPAVQFFDKKSRNKILEFEHAFLGYEPVYCRELDAFKSTSFLSSNEQILK